MKAGRAGSIPAGARSDKIVHSQALHVLLRDIGKAVFALNTAVVGLDAVEKGHEKPTTLDISWQAPDREAAARTSRKFIVESVMIRASEALSQFTLALSKLSRFGPAREQWKGNTSSSERVSSICAVVLDKDDYLVPAAVLLVHWRNRIVHASSNAKLKDHERQVLLNNKSIIFCRYKGLEISELLKHFEAQRPTLKDASSLIAMTINLARKMDRTMQQNLTKEELDAWLDHYQIFPMLKKLRAETAPKKYGKSVRRLFQSRAPYLLDAYLAYYDPEAN